MEHPKNRVSRPAQINLFLRLAAGAYLIYLSYGLVKEAMLYTGNRQLLLIGCIFIFSIVGAVLGGWTIKKLIKGEFIRFGESEDSGDKRDE